MFSRAELFQGLARDIRTNETFSLVSKLKHWCNIAKVGYRFYIMHKGVIYIQYHTKQSPSKPCSQRDEITFYLSSSLLLDT